MKTSRTVLALLIALALAAVTAGCSRLEASNAAGNTPAADKGPAAELRLGYFPNVTHAPALIGVEKGFFTKELGSTKLSTQTFNSGTEASAALLGGSLDLTFIGSGPTINAFDKSKGEALRLISGVNYGGAQLVARPEIENAEQLRGKKIAAPQRGNTQDVALRKWLAEKNLPAGGGPDQVSVINGDNPQTFDAYRNGDIDAAWLPEPWSSRLVLDAGAKVLVDERDLWPDGKFPTTVLIVRTQYLAEHPQTVQSFLRGLLASIDWANGNKVEAQAVANEALKKLTGKALSQPVIERAFANITLSLDPLAATFPQLAKDAVTTGSSKSTPDLKGLVDLGLLNGMLTAVGKPTVDAAGLDKK